MTSIRDINIQTVKNYIEYFKENKLKFSILVLPNNDILNLPNEAKINNNLFATFDYGAEETWVAEQIEIFSNEFKCCLVYQGVEGWDEYWISFPLENIIAITQPEHLGEVFTYNVHQSTITNEFRTKVNYSKSKLKLIKSWEE